MKKIVVVVLALLVLLVVKIYTTSSKTTILELRNKHMTFLKNSPVKEVLKLSKKERRSKGLPPNKYYERQWELTLNPETGKPEPEKTLQLQKELRKKRKGLQEKTPGDSKANSWVERGPNNVGGRTRSLLFDPNDPTGKRVFAGGVSGGLWVNEDITNTTSKWTRIINVPSNMSVNCMTVDPNDSKIFYLGTGELYTQGAVTGNGVYKSVDGGVNWSRVFGADYGTVSGGATQKIVEGEYFIQDIIAWNNSNKTEVFIAVGASFWQYGGAITTFLGEPTDYGVYKTTNGGTSWSKPTIPLFNDRPQQPNDFEIGADNKIWLSTTSNYFGELGGGILSSTNGSNFTEVTRIADAIRTEIEVSETDSNKLYVLAQTTENKPIIYSTSNGFQTDPTELSLPNDSDDGIEADDFTRNQSFYNLMIECDPTNDAIVYVGGINLFRSSNNGTSWSQISKRNSNVSGNFSEVHADQHAMVFRPVNSNQAIFGNDGGVYYASSLNNAATSATVFTHMVSDYNVTQFYTAAIAPSVAEEYFMGGTQDNGTPYFANSTSASSVDISGGDGAACFVDQVGEDFLIVSYVYNDAIRLYDFAKEDWRTINEDEESDGDFINQADLDSNLDLLYTNGSDFENEIYRLYRYSNLKTISANGSATKATLTDALLKAAPTAIKVSPYTTTSTKMLVGTEAGDLFIITNANGNNASWTKITGSEFLGSISDVEFGADENEIFVSFHNYGVVSIWYSNDAGSSWQNKEGDFPDIPVKAILSNPEVAQEVIIATELGVWKTGNWDSDTPNWVQTYNGMSDVKVNDLQLRKEDNTVLAATFGRGLYTGLFASNAGDTDNDGILNTVDNCVFIANENQEDNDNDGAGDVCDDDDDNDGVLDSVDNCPMTSNPKQIDVDEDGIGDVCDDVIDTVIEMAKGFSPNGDGVNDTWQNTKIAQMFGENMLQILDKSGNLLYKGDPFTDGTGWDGFANVGTAKKLTVGSYVYVIHSKNPVATYYPEVFQEKGWLYIKY
ncbi:thrombospondin type 3 repeat-containing protein [Flavicella sediminum]|uniref:thrombospondin type 3 repeat-containing protein n=1 Tax=Flavicella sediminum TaxID=2585141 RepID=UPI00111F819A|nr:thrombospondin type 3 repeat-containing protein [Flavicella sediminum]